MTSALQLRYRPGARVVPLDDERATDATRAGGKAARLSQAARAGLPVIPGFVLCTHGTVALLADAGSGSDQRRALEAELREAWEALTEGGHLPVVVRSSSPVEDTEVSSMAGQFHSEVDVRGWAGFLDAVAEVAASGQRSGDRPPLMAVLVQRHLDPDVCGVLFGVDPVTGEPDHRVVVAVAGGPQALVGGATEGTTHTLSAAGRLLVVREGADGRVLRWRERRALVALERRAREQFDGPQDIEWAIDGRSVWLLQSRPITAVTALATGPIYGTGPLGETFPEPLSPLEQELWLPPLAEGLREALALTGTASRRRLRSPLVVAPAGWAAVDLDIIGSERRSALSRLDPRPGFRKLRSSWRIGRTRAALGAIVAALVQRADDELGRVPPLDRLDDEQLLRLLDQGRAALRSLHGHEMLAALLERTSGPTGLELALHALGDGRALGQDDDELRSRRPEVLALTAPRIGPPAPLPDGRLTMAVLRVEDLPPREALRLRVRWLHEVTARTAFVLGQRLALRGQLAAPTDVRDTSLAELETALADPAIRPRLVRQPRTGPPPVRFRMNADGPVAAAAAGDAAAQGAGGGRGQGPVHVGSDPPEGAVLVTSTLAPTLAPLLPRLAGLVAETGSPLSHLAILAREHGVPTVIGFRGATERFVEGDVVVVDGTSGEVDRVLLADEASDLTRGEPA